LSSAPHRQPWAYVFVILLMANFALIGNPDDSLLGSRAQNMSAVSPGRSTASNLRRN
jgi:hypothetical protein